MKTKVCIYTRKDKLDERAKVKEIERVVGIAAQIVRKEVEIEVSHNLRDLANISVNVAMTPIITINGTSAFAKEAPSVQKMQTALLTVSSPVEMF